VPISNFDLPRVKSAFLALGTCVALCWLAACQRPAEEVAPTPPSAATAVQEFFSSYDGNFRAADPQRLSRGLVAALQSAAEGEKQSAARVKASDFPNDKPQILEGEIFSGLYEGFTGFETGPENITDGQAVVEVRFRNEHYDVDWTDEVVLIDEDGWKIDDIRYIGKKAGLLSLREVLQDFDSAVAAEAAALSSTNNP
jgi:hypothetical protein